MTAALMNLKSTDSSDLQCKSFLAILVSSVKGESFADPLASGSTSDWLNFVEPFCGNVSVKVVAFSHPICPDKRVFHFQPKKCRCDVVSIQRRVPKEVPCGK